MSFPERELVGTGFFVSGGDSPDQAGGLAAVTGITQARLQELVSLIAAGQEARFYDWPEWDAVREDVLRLDRGECQRCRLVRHRYRRAALVHHVKHLKDRPDLALSIWDGKDRQLVSLCRACHEEEHPERQWRKVIRKDYVTQERWD